MNLSEFSSEGLLEEEIEPGILKQLVISHLEEDPWRSDYLGILADLSFGDEKRLYLLDMLRSDPSNREFLVDTIIWEIEEERSSSSTKVQRLSDRIYDIVALNDNLESEGLDFFSGVLSEALRQLFNRGETKSLIIALKAAILASRKIPGLTELLLNEKIPGTKTAVIELFRVIDQIGESLPLLQSVSKCPYLFSDINIRRVISREVKNIGDSELSYWLSMKSVDIYPQDQESALNALESAISIGNDAATLVSGGTLLAMKNEPSGIPYHKIAEASLRKGRKEYAKDLLRRRRMKLGIEGHRLRIGIPFHEGNYEEALEEISRTPKPYSYDDSIRSYKIFCLSLIGNNSRTDEEISLVSDPLERRLLEYHCFFRNEKFSSAAGQLNQHFSNYGMRKIGQKWEENRCNFHHLDVIGDTPEYTDHGKISVIMTCHRNNPALKLAVDSVLNQSYPNIEFIFVDDHSSEKDVRIYDEILDEKVIRIRMPENRGTYACRNRGLKIAKGKFVTFADSDDWIHPDKIGNAIEYLVESRAEMVVGRYIRVDESGEMSWNGVRFARFGLVGMTVRTSTLREKLVGFDERMRHSADSELFERARMVLGKKRVLRYPVIGLLALDSQSSLTRMGGLAINWFGSSGERAAYNYSFRRNHQQLMSGSSPRKSDFFNFRVEDIDIPKELLELRNSLGFDQLKEECHEFSSCEDGVLVTMCTYPGGFSTVGEAVQSLLFKQTKEISELRLIVNGEDFPEDLPEDSRLTVIKSDEDVTDRGKFIEIRSHEGYVITADDDIRYPEDYVEKMVSFVDSFDRKSLVGVHGSHIPRGPPITRWWEYANIRRSHVFAQEMPEFVPVNVIGTGTLAFHTSIGKPDASKFDYQRMVDLHFAVWAQKNFLPMYICPRKRNWLEEINPSNVGRIWESAREDGGLQHRMLEVLQRCRNWELYSSRIEGKFERDGIFGTFLSWMDRELCPGMNLPEVQKKWPEIGDFPLVTIYIPAYNCEDFIIDSIKSALDQTYRNFEICVHNDGSTDRTLAKIRRKFVFNRKVKISSSENQGIGGASNSAINNGSGELILQLDSDDLLHPKALEILVSQMREGVVCSYGSFIRISKEGEKIDDGWDWPYYTHHRLLKSMIVHHPRLFRRKAWEEVGGFDENLTNAVDYDFFLKLGEIGGMEHLSEKLYSYRIHESSTSQEKRGIQTDNTLVVQLKALERMGLGDFVNYAPNPDFPRRIQYRYRAFSNRL